MHLKLIMVEVLQYKLENLNYYNFFCLFYNYCTIIDFLLNLSIYSKSNIFIPCIFCTIFMLK